MSPGHKRRVAEGLVARGRCSGRKVCRYLKLHRSRYRYPAKEPNAWGKRLRAAVRGYSLKNRKWGYVKITRLLENGGFAENWVFACPGASLVGVDKGLSAGLPTQATHRGHVWCGDFIHDRTRAGRLDLFTKIPRQKRHLTAAVASSKSDWVARIEPL